MDESDRHWNQQMLCQLFSPSDVDAILQIPISQYGTSDHLIWMHSKDGIFTVSLAYQLALELFKRSLEGPSITSSIESWWKAIWSLIVPGSIRHFLWQVCHEILPIRCNLPVWNVIDSAGCPICACEVETTVHALWTYPGASDVWGDMASPLRKWPLDFPSRLLGTMGSHVRILPTQKLSPISVIL